MEIDMEPVYNTRNLQKNPDDKCTDLTALENVVSSLHPRFGYLETIDDPAPDPFTVRTCHSLVLVKLDQLGKNLGNTAYVHELKKIYKSGCEKIETGRQKDLSKIKSDLTKKSKPVNTNYDRQKLSLIRTIETRMNFAWHAWFESQLSPCPDMDNCDTTGGKQVAKSQNINSWYSLPKSYNILSQVSQKNDLDDVNGTGQGSQVSQESDLGDVNDTVQGSQVSHANDLDDVNGTGQVSQVSQENDLGDVNDTGQGSQVSQENDLGDVNDTGQCSQVSQENCLGDVNDIGQCSQIYSENDLNDVRDIGQSSQISQESDLGSEKEAGQGSQVIQQNHLCSKQRTQARANQDDLHFPVLNEILNRGACNLDENDQVEKGESDNTPQSQMTKTFVVYHPENTTKLSDTKAASRQVNAQQTDNDDNMKSAFSAYRETLTDCAYSEVCKQSRVQTCRWHSGTKWILRQWFVDNIEHLHADQEELQELAMLTGLPEKKVRLWVEKSRTQLSCSRKILANQDSLSLFIGCNAKTCSFSRCRWHSENRNILTEWFMANIGDTKALYPNDDKLCELASQTDMTDKQVSSWISTSRSLLYRSHKLRNTDGYLSQIDQLSDKGGSGQTGQSARTQHTKSINHTEFNTDLGELKENTLPIKKRKTDSFASNVDVHCRFKVVDDTEVIPDDVLAMRYWYTNHLEDGQLI